jgi:hypothetical protein
MGQATWIHLKAVEFPLLCLGTATLNSSGPVRSALLVLGCTASSEILFSIHETVINRKRLNFIDESITFRRI